MKGLGKVINELREQRGITKAELADAAGLNRVTIYRLEQSGKIEFTSLAKIAAVLGVDVAYLLTPPELRNITKTTAKAEAQSKQASTSTVTLTLEEYNKLISELAILREKSKKG